MTRFRWYRWILGGTWYKHTMTGELPNCYGSWWDRKPTHHPRFERITKVETYS